jgi:uncharacterized protein YdeI (YjbR/CyaY-like superfamily)
VKPKKSARPGANATPVFFPTPADFRGWLEKHHATEDELMVGFYRKGTGKPSIDWKQSVDEALCFGWIDGVRRKLNDEAYVQRFTPRRKGSHWSKINVARVEELTKAGRMAPAGLAAFALRRDEPHDAYSNERPMATLEPAQERRLRANKAAAEFFDAQPLGYRKVMLHWVTIAKRAETRERRLDQLIELSAAGKRHPAMSRPTKTKE